LARELKSEEQTLRAAEAQDLSLDITNIVVNCPITRPVDGRAIRGAQQCGWHCPWLGPAR
jgi:hypothetical protein